MKNYEYEDDGGRILCKQHDVLRCFECDYVDELEKQNKHYRELLESISTTNKVASEIFSKKDGKTLISPDDILQEILRKVNKRLEESE